MARPSPRDVQAFYDGETGRKLRDFVFGNRRIDVAWETLSAHAGRPRRILEIGCAVGAVSWFLASRFPSAAVVGIDISAESVALARRAFARSNLTFERHDVSDALDMGEFDLIVLMDVYEHVLPEARPVLHRSLRQSLSSGGRVVLTWPTPRHLAYVKQADADEIQPVDEEISIQTIGALARDLGRDVLLYREVGVWKHGDYAHAVVGRSPFPQATKTRGTSPAAKLRQRSIARRRISLLTRAGISLNERE